MASSSIGPGELGSLVERRRAVSSAVFETSGVVRSGDREFRQVMTGRAGVWSMLHTLGHTARAQLRSLTCC